MKNSNILRRSFLKQWGSAFTLLGLGLSTPSIARASQNTPKKKGVFAHQVFIWLKEPKNTEAQKTFEQNTLLFFDACKDLIRDFHVGKPANTPREVVDNSYSYSLVVFFDSREDHDAYQEHPAHKKFIADTSNLWNKVLVYDSNAIKA